MEAEVLEALIRWAEDEITRLKESVSHGSAQDYAQYQYYVGQVWSLQRMLDEYKDISNKFLEDG